MQIGLLYFVKEIKLFNSIPSLLNMLLKRFKDFIGNKNNKANIFRLQANNSIMCGYVCIGCIDVMLAGKTLVDFTSLFSPYAFEKK